MPFVLRKLIDRLVGVFNNLLNSLQKIFFRQKKFVFVCELPATPAPIQGQFRDFGFIPLFQPRKRISVRNLVVHAIALKRYFRKC
jgi:hypothetical protein